MSDGLGSSATLLDVASGRRFSRYGRRYRAWIHESLRLAETRGLAMVTQFTPDLDDVDVGLGTRPPGQIRGGVLDGLDVMARYLIKGLVDGEMAAVLAVIGAPGSGKTTLLRNVAR